jgi:hypothetical protein
VKGKQPELWDPLTGSIRDLKVFSLNGELTEIPLELDTNGSAFIVFRNETLIKNKTSTNYPEFEKLMTITTPWEVTFDKSKGGPEQVVIMNEPEDWSVSKDERIKYYSGNAMYRNKFTINELPQGKRFIINIGKANVMAEIRINGKFSGGVWTYPWKTDITDQIIPGENIVEIEVVNNWINRLIGDTMKDEKERITWLNENPAKPEDPLQPSGLMGPITIESVRY